MIKHVMVLVIGFRFFFFLCAWINIYIHLFKLWKLNVSSFVLFLVSHDGSDSS